MKVVRLSFIARCCLADCSLVKPLIHLIKNGDYLLRSWPRHRVPIRRDGYHWSYYPRHPRRDPPIASATSLRTIGALFNLTESGRGGRNPVTAHKGLSVGARFFPRSPYDGDTLAEQRRLKRRQAVEPSIGHLKVGHRMRRYFLKGALGDAMNPILAAAGFNNRWLMRWLVIDWRWILSAALGLFDQGDSDALSELGSAAASRNVQECLTMELAIGN